MFPWRQVNTTKYRTSIQETEGERAKGEEIKTHEEQGERRISRKEKGNEIKVRAGVGYWGANDL